MATMRLLFRPSVSHPLQTLTSCSSSARKSSPNSSREDTCQSSSSDSNMKGEKSFTRSNVAGSRNTHLARKVATQQVLSSPITEQSLNVEGLPSTFTFKTANWKLNPSQTQGLIERVIVDCRFFTFLAIAGSLIGSILCFVEGFVMVMQSYFRYFEAAALHKLGHGSVVELLIEAIDMFLLGTALLIFGMGLYVMFVRPRVMLPVSNGSGLFYLKGLPSWLKMESVSEAKTRVGHAVVMILQVGMLEKFKSVPLVTGLDLASFAGAVLISSASIFCLSKLSNSEVEDG